jgi:hypothetical protein
MIAIISIAFHLLPNQSVLAIHLSIDQLIVFPSHF